MRLVSLSILLLIATSASGDDFDYSAYQPTSLAKVIHGAYVDPRADTYWMPLQQSLVESFRREVAPAEARVGKGSLLDLQHVTLLGCHLVAADGKVTMEDTVIGLAPEKNGLWGAARGAKAGDLLKELTPK